MTYCRKVFWNDGQKDTDKKFFIYPVMVCKSLPGPGTWFPKSIAKGVTPVLDGMLKEETHHRYSMAYLKEQYIEYHVSIKPC